MDTYPLPYEGLIGNETFEERDKRVKKEWEKIYQEYRRKIGPINCTMIGSCTGHKLLSGNGSVFIGENAGADLLDADDIIIIGDNIRSLDRKHENVLFIGNKIAIGDTIFGRKLNLKEILLEKFQLKE